MTNVTAFHGYNAVHLGGRELTNGRWTPACRIQHHNAGGREVTPLRPTDKAVTCKRCLKVIAAKSELKEIPNYAVQELKASRMTMNKPPMQQTSKLGRKLAKDHGLNFF